MQASLALVSPTGAAATGTTPLPSPAMAPTASPTGTGALPALDGDASASDSALPQSITAELDSIVIALYGDAAAEATNKDPDPKAAKEIIDLMFEFDLFRRLLDQTRSLEFEARKFFTRIFEYALTQRRELAVPYMLKRRGMIMQCIRSYDEKDVSIALSGDAILRACIVCEPITEMILASGSLPEAPSAAPSPAASGTSPAATGAAAAASPTAAGAALADSNAPPAIDTASAPTPTAAASAAAASASSLSPSSDANCNMVLPFFRYLDLPTFINSHAFANFRLLLTSFPVLSAAYLKANYDAFFTRYNRLLTSSDNYLTKVQSFNFLGELLMTRENQEVMMRYVHEESHLKIAMLALRGPKAIQLAVFNVLKIFVPNPYKSDGVLRMLTQNKRNFLSFLEEFEKDSEDEVLQAHKREMQEAFWELPDVAPAASNRKQSDVVGNGGAAAQAAAQAVAAQMQLQQQQQQQAQQPSQQQLSDPVVTAASADELP